MAMGFGTQMEGSPMVVMWPNSDGTITLSQRQASGEVMPVVASSPPRVATLSTSLSSTSGTKPKLAFTIPANSDKQQNIIWAISSQAPSSSAVSATIVQHDYSGIGVLDLTKTTTSSSSSTTDPASSGSSYSSSSSIPLLPFQKAIIAHAVLCATGFLILLPAGALLARYLRTFIPTWFTGHWIAQFALAGPVIITGVSLGIRGVQLSGAPHFNDPHKQWGIAIFSLYLFQCAIGAFIHWVKPRNARRRPFQNYLHAVVGLLLIALALFQVRTGFAIEWPTTVGRGAAPGAVNVAWYVWAVLLPLLYFAGLSLLPRQFRQEKAAKTRQNEFNLHSRYRSEPEVPPLRKE